MKKFSEALAHRKRHGLLRELPQLKNGIDFYSNDYLGIARFEVSLKHHLGSTGSRLLSGNSKEIEDLEREIAEFHNSDAALLFNSGYTANLGLISAIADRNDYLIIDEHSHASIIDGCRLSLAHTYKFKHNNIDDLEKKISKASGNIFVITERIFSMDGTSPDLIKMGQLCEKHQAHLIIDEAHSSGIRLSNKVNSSTRVVTYGKAFGNHGAAILCSQELKEFLINFSRPFIYTTAPSPGFLASIKHSYKQVKESDNQRLKLSKLIQYWNSNKPDNFHWISSDSQIQSLLISGNESVTGLANHLKTKGILGLPIKSPTVAKGEERIRFCLHSFNLTSEIELLFNSLKEWQEK